jgi:hypothetical protein
VPRARAVSIVGATVLALTACSARSPVASTHAPAADARDTARPLLALLADPPPTRSIPYLTQNPQFAVAPVEMDLAGARVAATSPTGSDLIAVERKGGTMICVIATDRVEPRSGAGACATREQFRAQGVFAALVEPDSRELIALLPDGVATVLAADAQGKGRTVAVRKNAIRLPIDQANVVTFYIGVRRVVQDFTQTPTHI